MKTKRQLINNVIGQLEGVSKMIENEEDCRKVIIQMKAARSAFEKFMGKYIKENIARCSSSDSSKKTREEMEGLISELIKNS